MDFFENFWDILLWSLWFFFIITFFMIMFRIFGDIFSDKSIGGAAKTGWVLLIIFLPLLGCLIYLIARGRSMAERQMAQMRQMQAAQEEYIRQAAGTAANPAEQIASAKALLDSGAISQAEFDALKAKALA
ncbi:MAG: SHOCT domain-containing protein [Candidatus Nanopelagicales bacterium]